MIVSYEALAWFLGYVSLSVLCGWIALGKTRD
jgi:hypothetical protein